jgi:hypothetical protein
MANTVHDDDVTSIGEILETNKFDGLKALGYVICLLMIGIGLVITAQHNYHLFQKTITGTDMELIPIAIVVLLDGSIVGLTFASFFWFHPGLQKQLATIFLVLIFAIVFLNTIVDSMWNAGDAMPDWLRTYATFVIFGTPVIAIAMWEVLLHIDPVKKTLDAKHAISFATDQAKHKAAMSALHSQSATDAIRYYGDQFSEALSNKVRRSAPRPGPRQDATEARQLPAVRDNSGEGAHAQPALPQPAAVQPTRRRTKRFAKSAPTATPFEVFVEARHKRKAQGGNGDLKAK